MATFVLVHGAFIGGWAWTRLRPLLRAAGHTVYTPTLTGCGERSHLLSAVTGYQQHVTDVVNVLKYEDLRDVILVGHSYGGMVITGVADQVPERIARLVYLDAQVPTHGQNAMGEMPDNTANKLQADSTPGEIRLLAPISLDAMGIFDPSERAWVEPLLHAFPMKCLEDVIELTHGEPTAPRSYIRCTDRASLISFFNGDPLARFVETARREDFRFYELPAGHHPMITHPVPLAETLRNIASPVAG
jgi:pimeloyl-ACP methyl ester carboxylesterase